MAAQKIQIVKTHFKELMTEEIRIDARFLTCVIPRDALSYQYKQLQTGQRLDI